MRKKTPLKALSFLPPPLPGIRDPLARRLRAVFWLIVGPLCFVVAKLLYDALTVTY